MPYSRITHTAFGAAAVDYALNGVGHDGSRQRNLYVGCVGMAQGGYEEYVGQFSRLWKHASEKNTNQIRRMIVSFSPKELDPGQPDSVHKAVAICTEIMNEYYPGFPAVMAVQNDGQGGKLHVHILACNVSAVDYKGFTDEQTSHRYLRNAVDTVCSRYFELDRGEKAHDKITQSERRKREENDLIREANRTRPEGEKLPLNYIWKDDLKRRVSSAMEKASDRDDFLKQLTLNGVEGIYRHSKIQGDYILYELTDISGFEGKVPENLKSKSYKLGTDYDLDKLDERIRNNTLKAKPVPVPTPRPAPTVPTPQAPTVKAEAVLQVQHEPQLQPRKSFGKPEERQQQPAKTLEKPVNQGRFPIQPPADPENARADAEADRQRRNPGTDARPKREEPAGDVPRQSVTAKLKEKRREVLRRDSMAARVAAYGAELAGEDTGIDGIDRKGSDLKSVREALMNKGNTAGGRSRDSEHSL